MKSYLDLARDSIKAHEGEVRSKNGRHKLYMCPSKARTIGWGRNLDANGLSDEEAEILLNNDMRTAERACRSLIFNFETLDPVRQAVLIEMAFNIGSTKLAKFTKMLKALRQHDYLNCSSEMKDSDWYIQTKRRAKTLVERMRTGVME